MFTAVTAQAAPPPRFEAQLNEKSALRQKMMALRHAAPRFDEHRLIALFMQKFAPLNCQTIAGYWAMNGELDPAPLLDAAFNAGAQICLPAITAAGHPLIFRAYDPGDPLVAGPHKTREPNPAKPVCSPKIIIVPLLAVDATGARLGYGGGYYDRTLATFEGISVGLAHDVQLLDTIPCEAHDQCLDFVLTPNRLIEC